MTKIHNKKVQKSKNQNSIKLNNKYRPELNKVSVFMMLLHPALIMYVYKYAGTKQNFLRIENTAMFKGIVNEKEQISFSSDEQKCSELFIIFF